MCSELIAIAWHPGAARAVAPVVVEAGRRGWTGVMATSATSAPIARRAGVERLRVLTSAAQAASLLDGHRDAVALTGVSEGDTPEKHLIAAARVFGIPSCAVLDNWGSYEERLMGTMGARALPDLIAVMNDEARRAIADAGFFRGRLVVTGQPGLDEFERMAPIDVAVQSSARRVLGVPPGREVVVFASQPLAQQFGPELGYDQYDAIALLESVLPQATCLVVAVHPREDAVLLASRCPERAMLVHDYDPAELYAAADIVASCFSAALTESLLAGRPTVAIRPQATRRDAPGANVCGAVFDTHDAEQLASALRAARIISPFDLEQRRGLLGIPSGATAHVMQLVEELSAANDAA